MGASKLQLEDYDAEYVKTHTPEEVKAHVKAWEKNWPALRPAYEKICKTFPGTKLISLRSIDPTNS